MLFLSIAAVVSRIIASRWTAHCQKFDAEGVVTNESCRVGSVDGGSKVKRVKRLVRFKQILLISLLE